MRFLFSDLPFVFSDAISTFHGKIAKLNTPLKAILVATFAVFRGNLRESVKRPKCPKTLAQSGLRAHAHTRENGSIRLS